MIVAMESEKKEKDEEDLGFVDVMKSLKQMKTEEFNAFADTKLALKQNNAEIEKFAITQGKMHDDEENGSINFD